MKVGKLKYWLSQIQDEGYGDYVVNFSDQDNDYYTVDIVYEDDEEDCCLQSVCDYTNDLTADELMEELDAYDDDTYVYMEHLDEDGDQEYVWEHIEGGWYFDDDGDLVMDMTYENTYDYDDDDEDDYDDDEDDYDDDGENPDIKALDGPPCYNEEFNENSVQLFLHMMTADGQNSNKSRKKSKK